MEHLLNMLLESPDAPLEQAYLTYKIEQLAGRRLGIPVPPPHPCNIEGQSSTALWGGGGAAGGSLK